MTDDRRATAANNATLGVVWKLLAALGVPTLITALGLWRGVALLEQDLKVTKAELAEVQKTLKEHLAAEIQAVSIMAAKEKDAAIAQVTLTQAISAVKGQIDALLIALSRRRPG